MKGERPIYGRLTPAEAKARRRQCQSCGTAYRSAIHGELCAPLREAKRLLDAAAAELRARVRQARPKAPATLRRNRYRRST